MAEQDDVTARFEKRWQEAMAQPELVEAPAVTIDIDLSPMGVLTRLRELDRSGLGRGAEEIEGVLDRLRDRFL